MGLFSKKKDDPISERARDLSAEIAALENQIKELNARQQAAPPGPRLKSTAPPGGGEASFSKQHLQRHASGPVFEDVDQKFLKSKEETAITEDQLGFYNEELGVRKFDLAGLIARAKNNFRGPATNNPKLVKLLAAGSVRGLRPMRYEKRVARNRFLFVTTILLALLVGIFLYIRHH